MPTPDQEVAENRQRFIDAQTAARQAGATWDQIHQTTASHVQRMREAGATEQQIEHSYGFSGPQELIAATQTSAEQHLAATKPTSWVGAFVSGLTHSSAAALLGVKPSDAPVEGHVQHLLSGAGETIGDIPAMVTGGIMGAVTGATAGGAGGAVAGAVAGGGPEDVPADVGGAVAGGGFGAYVGGSAGTMALPQLIKSERDRYTQALAAGQVKGPGDYLRIQGQVMKDTAEAAAVGVVTAGAGKVVSPLLEKMGANKVVKFLGTAGAETATMVTAQSALAGRMPKMEDFVDGAITIGAFHTAVHLTAPGYRAVRTRLMQHYTDTGELPQAAADRAVHDPVFRAQMMGQPDPRVPAGSSHTPTNPAPEPGKSPAGLFREVRRDEDGNIFLNYQPSLGKPPIPIKMGIDNGVAEMAVDQFGSGANKLGPAKIREAMHDLMGMYPEIKSFAGFRSSGAGKGRIQEVTPRSDTYVIPRIAGDFDHGLAWILKEEGGLTTDTGGLTKYGISAKAHPGVDVANLSQQDAAEIYHREYWRAIDADALPPNMRLAAFDSAVNQGVGQTKTWLKDAGGDLQKFMQMRVAKYAQLARDPKYAKYAPAWANRLKDLGASDAMADIVHNGPDNVGRDFSEDDRKALALDNDGGGNEPPKPPESGAEPPDDEDPWRHVMSRVAPDEGTNWLDKTVDTFKLIYGELFDPGHPIRKLVDSVTKGEPLDDYSNPELLFRVAENSGTVAQWAIEKQMVDLDGKVTGPSLVDIVSGKSQYSDVKPGFLRKFVGRSNEDVKKFLDGYAVAKWAIMMDAQGKKSGVDIDKAKAAVADGSAQFEASFQHLVDWRNGTLKWLADGGVHDKAKVDKLIAENGSTIPGYRRMEDGSYKPVSTGKPGIWNPIKTAKGSERLVEPILKSLMQDAYLRHELAANNRSMLALTELGLKGNHATQKRAVDINVVSAIDELKERGIDEDMLSGLAKSAGVTLPRDQVPVFRDGKLYGVKFDDPELTRVLRGYDQSARSTVMKVIGAITSVPRNMQTRFNPLFPIRLLTYDLPWQYIVNPDSKGPYFGFLSGLGHMTGDAEGYAEWARSGGAERVFSDISKDAFMKRVLQGHEDQSLGSNMWNAVKSPFEALTAWTRMVSTPLRLGRYTRGVAQGETPLRAAVGSSEAAFHRPGYGGPVGKAWNTIVPYTTAHLNGMEKSVRALLGLGRTVTGVEYSSRRTITRAAAMITVPFIAQWFAYKDEEWYKAMPEYQKNTAWFIVPPIDGSPPIPVAAPPILSALFVALPRMLLENYINDNPHAGDDIWETLGASLMPPGMLTGSSILTPVVEHIANYSFHKGRPLVSADTVRGVQPAEQFTQYSSPAAKGLAQFASDLPLVHSNLGWSPAVVDNYISQWGGTPGRLAADAAASALGGAPSNPPVEQRVSDWPGISSWMVRYPSASAQPIQQFYDASTKLDQMHGSLVKQIREGNFEAFKRIVDQGGPSAAAWQNINLGQNIPPGVDLGPYLGYLAQASSGADYQNLSLAHQAKDALKNARDYSWRVYEDENKTGHDKRQILDMVNAQMQVISERGNEAMDRAMIGVKRPGRAAKAPVPDSIYFEQPPSQ